MAENITHDELALLRAELTAQRAEFAAFREHIEADRQRRSSHRMHRRILPLALVALLVALAPLSVLATNPFNDLNPNSVHNANIDAIYNAHITTGCDPDVSYCPNANVTREEMASFLARLGGLGSNPPVANALQLNGLPSSSYLRPVGDLVIPIAPAVAAAADPDLSVSAIFGYVQIKSTAAGYHDIDFPLPVPSTLFGVNFRLASVEACYSVTNSATKITNAKLYYSKKNGAQLIQSDTTGHASTAPECITLTAPALTTLPGGPILEFQVNFADPSHAVLLFLITVTLTPVS